MNGKSLTLAAWILTTACTGGREEKPEAESSPDAAAEQPGSAESPPAQSQSFSRGTVPMTIVGSVAGHAFQASGTGECASSADASIFEVPAMLWHAVYADDGSQVNLTVWRPKAGGGDMVGLSLTVGETPHRIATVKGGELTGSGTAKVQPAGSGGGTLTVTGSDDHGHAVELSVECARFDEVVAEGG